MASRSSSDAFESIKAPQFYESLPVMDSLMDDGADEFFDVMSTPQRPPKVPEEFLTPGVLPDMVPRMEVESAGPGPSKTPMNVTPPAPPAPAKTTLSPVVEEPEPEDEEGGSDDRRKSSSDAAQGRVILKARRRSWQAPKPLMSEEVVKKKDAVESLPRRVFDGINLDEPIPEKDHPMTTRQDVLNKTPKLSLRSRSVIRSQMKRKSTQSPCGQSAKPPAKYRAMAEQLVHFFKDTPPRFHSVPASEPPKFPVRDQLLLTMPQSPHLRTKQRHRSPSPPPVEEKVQIKAHPLNPKVFQPPDMSSRPPTKPATVPQPFNLTEVPKKEQKPEIPEMVEFKARPVPRSCRSSLSSVCSNASTVSMRRVPAYEGAEVYEERDGVVEKKRVNDHVGVPQSHLSRGTKRVEVKPFSFDMRDRIARQKKEERIRQAIEESTKFPKFTARPLPSYINATSDNMSDISSVTSISSRKSIYHNHMDESSAKPTFKANPPTVLFKEPFIPKKANKPLTDVTEVQLNTERRAKERAEYEKAVQKQAEEVAQALKKRQEEDEKKEKAQIRNLRKSLVHKAKPVPKFVAATTIQEE